MAIIFSATSPEALALIVAHYNALVPAAKHLSVTDFVFDAPVVDPRPNSPKNTLLVARPLATSGKYGAVRLHYNRMALSQNIQPTMGKAISQVLSAQAFIAHLNTQLNVAMSAEDFEPFSLPPYEDGLQFTVTLTAKPNAYLWQGSASVNMSYAGEEVVTQYFTSVLYATEVSDALTIQTPRVVQASAGQQLADDFVLASPTLEGGTLEETVAYEGVEPAADNVFKLALARITAGVLREEIVYKDYVPSAGDALTLSSPTLLGGSLTDVINYIDYDVVGSDALTFQQPKINSGTLT